MIGQTVSHYHILDRFVALKFLPPDLTRDAEAKQRFMQEAKAASALDHPNICTIYDIDETPDGQLFIAMAYYEGETLKQQLARGPLPLAKAFDIVLQVAQGLGQAHGAGIVHRDIKPANLMLTPSGLVKIVDFGLAKLVGQPRLTRIGTTMGTVAYMSPEQTRGEDVDHRTDIWSLGVTVYEMVTGQVPFRGEPAEVVMAAIRQQEPVPLTGLRMGVPLELERIVTRTLAKRAADRYQTVADLLSEVGRVQREWERDSEGSTMTMRPRPEERPVVAPAPAPAQAPRRARVKPWHVVGVVTALVLLIARLAVLFLRRAEPVPRLIRPTQITTAIGVEDAPSWSPEGGRLAYHSNQSGNWDIWVMPAGTGPARQITRSETDDDVPAWSSDGRQIAFRSSRSGNADIWVVPAAGGKERQVTVHPGVDLYPEWSSDGKWLVFTSLRTGIPRLWRMPAAGGEPEPLTQGPALYPRWSPDGKKIYFSGVAERAGNLWEVSIADRTERPVTDLKGKRGSLGGVALATDGQSLFFGWNEDFGDLWVMKVEKR